MEWITALYEAFLGTLIDVFPIAAILAFFQLVVLRQSIPQLGRVLLGFVYVILGLSLFLVGLEEALFPIGALMATQLTDPAFIAPGRDIASLGWADYYWVYLFAAAIGFSTTIAEPSLIAVANKASTLTGGTIDGRGLRIAVAIGVALSIAVGAFRIVTGTPLYLYMIAGYTLVPGRDPVLDGFGLIALASLFPMLSVMSYAQAGAWMAARRKKREAARSRFDTETATPQPGSQQ